MYMTKEEKLELSRNVGLFGLSDLRKLAPIGDLGYENGWYPPFFFHVDPWLDVALPKAIMQAFYEQKERFGYVVKGYSSGWARTDHHYYCEALGLSWHCDSGD